MRLLFYEIVFPLHLVVVRIDLIYEGIATLVSGPHIFSCAGGVRIDLIYEGIATYLPQPLLCGCRMLVRIDLIYEGIATLTAFLSFRRRSSM